MCVIVVVCVVGRGRGRGRGAVVVVVVVVVYCSFFLNFAFVTKSYGLPNPVRYVREEVSYKC